MRSPLLPIAALALLAVTACSTPSEEDADQEDQAVTTGGDLGRVSEARVLLLNEAAFGEKLRIIRSAKAGDALDLSYYIFSDDESGAFMGSELVAAAHRGAHVRLVLDLTTNYPRHHFFSAMQASAGENTSGGSLEFKYYGGHTADLREDMRFLLTPCSIPNEPITSAGCTADRTAKMNSQEGRLRETRFFTSVYAKNATGAKLAAGEVVVQLQAAAAAGSATTPVEKDAAAQALRLVSSAAQGDVAAMALASLGDKLTPLQRGGAALLSGPKHPQDWEHLTDFTHQKLTLLTSRSGDSAMVIGGRNMENSYHISESPAGWDSKYIFMDTDMYVKFRGAKVQERFERIWGFSTMVDTETNLGLDASMRLPIGPNGAMQEIVKPYPSSYVEDQSARFLDKYNFDGERVVPLRPGPAYKTADSGQLPTLAIEDARATYQYLENVPNPGGARVFGTGGAWDKDEQAGKNIHETWQDALEGMCESTTPKDVVVHNAYLLLPTRLQQKLSEIVREPASCPGVKKVVILTNSRESTDLNVINVFNESYIKPMLEQAKPGKLEYYEYTTQNTSPANAVSRSLHTKVMIFGDSIFVGSANADGRSKFMDANNGVYVDKAPKLVAAYKAWLGDQVIGKLAEADPHGIKEASHDALLDSNMGLFRMILQSVAGSLDESTREGLEVRVRAKCIDLYEVTRDVMPGAPDARSPRPADKGATNKDVMIQTDRTMQLL